MDSESGHNFQKLKESILHLSVSCDWNIAKKEWKLVSIYESEEADTCLCGHFPIIEICVLSNTLNNNRAEVGNRCVKRFLGLRSDLIFTGIKRIRLDETKSLNEDATLFFYKSGVLTQWEYDFQSSTIAKRKLSAKQLETRKNINRKVLTYMTRRGI